MFIRATQRIARKLTLFLIGLKEIRQTYCKVWKRLL